MFNKKTFLSFIGARASSQGLKDKNSIDFAGQPMIVWTIQASLKSTYIDRTLVSTDSEQIADVAKAAGADVPFLRPAHLAQSHSSIYDAIRHALEWIESNEKAYYDYIVLLMPTSPLRTSRHIDQAVEYYFQHQRTSQDTLVSVKKLPPHIGWLMRENEPGYIQFCFEGSQKILQRQEMKTYYLPNGIIYIAPTEVMKHLGFYTQKTLSYVMREEDSVDIDTQEDFVKALEKYYHGKTQ